MGFGGGSGGADSGSVRSRETRTYAAAQAAPVAPTVQAPTTDVVTPAVARDIGQDSRTAQQNQQLARGRLNGIRSTWAGAQGGRASRLGS